MNVAWPFIGISELKVLLPLFGGPQLRGELLLGTYADYAQILGGRPNDPGPQPERTESSSVSWPA